MPAGRRFVVNYVANAARYWADPAYDSTQLWQGVTTSAAPAGLARSLPGRSDVETILRNLECPTLVVVGMQDYGVPYTIWEALVANNPAILYVLMVEESHNPQTESPDRFDRVLLEWLAL